MCSFTVTVVVSAPLKAEPETKAWVQGVYLGDDLRKQKWGNGESEAGKEKKPVKVHYWVEYCCGHLRLSLQGTLWGTAYNTPQNCPSEGWEDGIFIHKLASPSGWGLIFRAVTALSSKLAPAQEAISRHGAVHHSCSWSQRRADSIQLGAPPTAATNSIHHSCTVIIASCLVSPMK